MILLANRKLHTCFPLVQRRTTFNDLEEHNGRVFCVTSLNSANFGADDVTPVEVRPYGLQQKCSIKKYVNVVYVVLGQHTLHGDILTDY